MSIISLRSKDLVALKSKGEPFRLIDVREPWEFKIAQIPGAELIPLAALAARWSEFKREEKLVIYCHHGSRSYHACSFLSRNGFTNVYNVEGGIEAYACEVDPSVQRY